MEIKAARRGVVVVGGGDPSPAAATTSPCYSRLSHAGQHFYSNMQVVMYSGSARGCLGPGTVREGGREGSMEGGSQASFPGWITVFCRSTLAQKHPSLTL